MAKVIGTVRQVVGDVLALSAGGEKRLLHQGDRLFAGEYLQTGADGAVAVRLAKGGELTLGRYSRLLLDGSILEGRPAHVETLDPLTPTLGIVQATDPTPDNAPSEPAVLGEGGGGHSVVLLSETGGEVTPQIGFPTKGLALAPIFPQGRDEFFSEHDDGPSTVPLPPIDEPPVIGPPDLEPPLVVPPLVVPPVVAPPVDEPPVIEPPVIEPPVEPPVEPPLDHCVGVSGDGLTLHEANLPQGSAPNPDALTRSGTFTVNAPDGLQSLIVGGIEVIRDGMILDFPQSAVTPLGNSLGITGYDPSNGTVSYSYTLLDPLAHSPGDGANSRGEQIEIVAVDKDGDIGSGSLDIVIVDDLPQACDIETSVTATPVNSNLLLIVDNSESMKLASGVDGLSRLDLAKQAISQLLSQYEAMGEVRVQIVTFNVQGVITSPVWVDVATAKAIIGALDAGNGTNYDAALAAAREAFGGEGRIGDGQNLAYFLSDGNPTLSPEHDQPNDQPDPTQGDGIDAGEEVAWKAFLDSHGIKSFAIGLGTDVQQTYLNPIAHDGVAHSDSEALIVTDLGELSAVLSGTLQGGTSGSLLAGGTFGTDRGFVRSISLDGITYSYDAQGDRINGGNGAGQFDTASRTLTLVTAQGGTLVVNMDSGAFSYKPGQADAPLTERVGFVLSDNDGDLAGATLLINVQIPEPAPCPEVVDDHIITNLLASSIEVPAAALLANDRSGDGGPLTATPAHFETGWAPAGRDFIAPTLHPVAFNGHRDSLGNQLKDLQRADFHATSAVTAMVLVHGYLGAWQGDTYNHQDLYSVHLKAGETLQVDTSRLSDQVGLAWQMDDGQFHALDANGSFTAAEDNVYRLILIHQPDPGVRNEGLDYQLGLTIDYGAVDSTPDYQGSYTAYDAHGGSSSAQVDILYQQGSSLIGDEGDDVLLAASGPDCLDGNGGNDILIGGTGNDILAGGEGQDRFMWLAGDSGHDRVTDLTPGVDTLDLSQLLQGAGATAETMQDYLHFRVSGTGAEQVSSIDVGIDAAHASQTIDLAGIDLAAQFGVIPGASGWIATGADTATIINGMLGDHSLKADVV